MSEYEILHVFSDEEFWNVESNFLTRDFLDQDRKTYITLISHEDGGRAMSVEYGLYYDSSIRPILNTAASSESTLYMDIRISPDVYVPYDDAYEYYLLSNVNFPNPEGGTNINILASPNNRFYGDPNDSHALTNNTFSLPYPDNIIKLNDRGSASGVDRLISLQLPGFRDSDSIWYNGNNFSFALARKRK